jgi:tetratricopeptide (TPR) repeat protein
MAPEDDDTRTATIGAPDRLAAPADAEPSAPRTFQPYEWVAHRYRVNRFLARGGMGEVYEAEDTELHIRVALKTLRAELSHDDALLWRFRREIALARRVTHPNVCRIFDLGFHDSPRGRVAFLTMELLDGESLSRRCARGRLSADEALPIVEQLAAGLQAAHAFGIIHRDLKSDNVMLVPSPTGGPVRAVITDFGLARSTEGPLASQDSGRLRGTPAYMAPEQVLGAKIKPAVDIYALGIVLYEMLTGSLPFQGDSPMATALLRLTRSPAPPRRIAPEVPARWEAVILRCLEREPERRFAAVSDVPRALLGEGVRPPAPKKPLMLLGALLFAGVLAATGTWWRTHRRSSPARRPSVAMLSLRNLSGRNDAAWLGTALEELVSGELVARGDVRRVPAESVDRTARQLQLPDGGTLAPDVCKKLRAQLDADYLLTGTYLVQNDAEKRLRVDLMLQDTVTGETVAADVETGPESSLFELVSQAGERLRRRLGLSRLSPADVAVARASLPADTTVARLYAEGLDHLRLLDALSARSLLEQATKADPDFPLGHAALSEAYRRLGHQADEEREARLAWEHSSGLSREEQLVVEANYRVSRSEWPRAVEVYRALHAFFPGSLDYGLKLARVQVDGGRGRDALDTVAQLRRETGAAANDPRIDLAEAQACEALADYPCEDRAAKAAEAKARALGANELLGDALLYESNAALTVGDRPRSAETANQAHRLFQQIGNGYSVGRALLQRANVARKTGQPAQARGFDEEAIKVYRELGDDSDLARAYLYFAAAEADLDHHPSSIESNRKAIPLFEKSANKAGLAAVHLNLGQQLEFLRQLDDAEKEIQAGLAIAQEIGNRYTQDICWESLGELDLARGQVQRSIEAEQECIRISEKIKDVTGVAQGTSKLGEALGYHGDVERGEKEFRKAIAALEHLGETAPIANAQVRLARLLHAVGRLDEAENLARSAVALHEKASVDTGESGAILTRVLVAQRKLDEARQVIEKAKAREDDASVEIAQAELDVVDGRAAHAVDELERLLASPPWRITDRMEAQLVLTRALQAAGRAREATALSRTLLAEAKQKQLDLVSRRVHLRD